MKIDVKSDKEAKILTWIAMDFSEEEGAMQKFSCRFKTEGIAAEFRVNFNFVNIVIFHGIFMVLRASFIHDKLIHECMNLKNIERMNFIFDGSWPR